MIDFDEELKKFKPALDVDDIEQYLDSIDLTDMNDIFTRSMLATTKSEGFGRISPGT